MTEMPADSDSPLPGDMCWFCRSAPAEAPCAAQTPLYSDVRIADVQTTFNGYNIKKTWQVLTVPVPRCRRCAGAHATRATVQGVLTLLPVLAVVAAAIWFHTELDGFIGVLVVSVIGGAVAAGLGHLVGSMLGWLVTPGSIPDESRRQEHPAVQVLLAQGWKVGNSPQPGEEFKGR